jgi:hypothetical protein
MYGCDDLLVTISDATAAQRHGWPEVLDNLTFKLVDAGLLVVRGVGSQVPERSDLKN